MLKTIADTANKRELAVMRGALEYWFSRALPGEEILINYVPGVLEFAVATPGKTWPASVMMKNVGRGTRAAGAAAIRECLQAVRSNRDGAE